MNDKVNIIDHSVESEEPKKKYYFDDLPSSGILFLGKSSFFDFDKDRVFFKYGSELYRLDEQCGSIIIHFSEESDYYLVDISILDFFNLEILKKKKF